jgi:ElaB/YqjD/DUF883 family membrane-anchored ribosome-binding protein
MNEKQGNGALELPQRMSEAQQQAQAQLERMKEGLDELDGQARSFIREHPGICVVGAVGLGFVIGRLVSRR